MNLLKIAFLFVVGMGVTIYAADFSIQQSIVFSVPPFNQVGNIVGPAPIFSVPQAGASSVCNNTYDISTNGYNKKIIGFLDANMPSNTCLSVRMAPPTGARSMGAQMLSTVPVDLVIEISCLAETGLCLVYTFDTEPGVEVITNDTRVVTFTMTDG